MLSRSRKILGLLNTSKSKHEDHGISQQPMEQVGAENNPPESYCNDRNLKLAEDVEEAEKITLIPEESDDCDVYKEFYGIVDENQTTRPISLVPAYDSDTSLSENGRNTCFTRRFTSSSSSSSSSSTSSSSTSSDSDSSLSSHRSSLNENHPVLIAESTNPDVSLITEKPEGEDEIIENTPEKQQVGCSASQRRCVVNCPPMTISPIYTDESDADDDVADPTYNFRNAQKRSIIIPPSSISASDSENDTQRRGRKRLRCPAKWKQNKAKLLRNRGEDYVSLSKTRKRIPSRCLKMPCTDKCRLKCTDKISTDERYEVFREYWDLGDLEKQRIYINSCMVTVQPKYKYTNAEKPRAPNKGYYLTVNNTKIRVCKKFFTSTLDVSDRMIHTIQHKNSANGFLSEDRRGKHGNHKKLSAELIDDIKKHINSIPTLESHYVRATSSRQFIDGGKTITDLYEDFVKQQKEDQRETGNYTAYYNIFTTQFNLSFYHPKKDQCDLCTSYGTFDDDPKKDIEETYRKHLKEKDLSRREKLNDREKVSEDNKVVIYDLEAVLQCPRGNTSAFYYKSKLNCYNLTLTELNNKEKKQAYDNVHCYFWTESDAKRGAVEIGSCVWDYLTKVACEDESNEKNIIFYSDNCCGQNKNKYNAAMYMYAVQNLNISTITHKYLIRGHTQNEADSVHSLIEREIKKNLKSGPIFSPDQYIALIKNAKKSKPPINVHELTYDSFMDTKSLQEDWGYNFSTNTNGQTVNWNDIKVIKITKENPFVFYYKTSYEDEIYQEVNVRNKRKKMNSPSDILLNKAYAQKQALSANKKKDLTELLTKGLIPSYYKNVYESILST